jgi:hypothetical protein
VLGNVYYYRLIRLVYLCACCLLSVIWTNLGKNHKELEFGKLASFATTVTICLLWTIPMAFFASLSSVEGLKEQFSWVADAIDAAPFLEPLLEQLAPLFVVVFNSLLPIILEAVTMLEYPISGSLLEPSLFVKLAAFMIIQTFFVSAISGSVTKEISNIIEDPLSIIDLLANSLPAQSTYFIQVRVSVTKRSSRAPPTDYTLLTTTVFLCTDRVCCGYTHDWNGDTPSSPTCPRVA